MKITAVNCVHLEKSQEKVRKTDSSAIKNVIHYVIHGVLNSKEITMLFSFIKFVFSFGFIGFHVFTLHFFSREKVVFSPGKKWLG